jgi:predicted transglutaminase-like cysteine proteinase
MEQYGVIDYWKRSLVGDCEDFALWVQYELSEKGIASVLTRAITEDGVNHMVVIVDGLWVLDNRKDWVPLKEDLPYTWP